jgi:hypothetical protein
MKWGVSLLWNKDNQLDSQASSRFLFSDKQAHRIILPECTGEQMENFHGIVVCGKDGDVQRAFGTIWKWDSISEASARHDL